MPTYSYACTECGNKFDTHQSFSDDPLTECPQCSGKLRKLFNSVGIVFKGSGFYRTDSRSGSASGVGPNEVKHKSDSGSDASGSSSGSSSSGGSSESSGGSPGSSSGSTSKSGAASPA